MYLLGLCVLGVGAVIYFKGYCYCCCWLLREEVVVFDPNNGRWV